MKRNWLFCSLLQRSVCFTDLTTMLYSCNFLRFRHKPAAVVQPLLAILFASLAVLNYASSAETAQHEKIDCSTLQVLHNDNETELCTNFTRDGQRNSYKISLDFINSTNNIRASADEITLTLQFTVERLYMLELIAGHWSGPITLVYYATPFDAEELRRLVSTSPTLSKRQNIVYHHVVIQPNNFYPINILRNIPMEHLSTNTDSLYVLPLDVDFLPRSGMHERLRKFLLSKKQQNKVAYIIPAFETIKNVSREELLANFPNNKTELIRMWHQGSKIIRPFQVFSYPESHAAMNFSRWNSSIDGDEPYEIQYRWPFEPTVVFRLPPSGNGLNDERFVGYGKDKATLPARLAGLGYKFLVLPQEFTVHVPHPPSEAKDLRNKDDFKVCSDRLTRCYRNQSEQR